MILLNALLMVLIAMPAMAKTPLESGLHGQPDGVYQTDGGWGSLTLSTDTEDGKTNARSFAIEAMGANGHSCTLSGKISAKGRVSITEDEDKICSLKFKADEKGIEIAENPGSENCQYYCGARAGFFGFYNRPDPICDPSAVRMTKWRLESASEQYEMDIVHDNALPILKSCAKTLSDTETAEFGRLVALAYYHAGDKKGCRKALTPFADVIGNTDGFEEMPPIEQEIWRGLAKNLRDVRDLCR